MSWCTIESDPGVFTELIAEIGVKGVQVEEIYGLDVSTFEKMSPVHGLIFLFKWVKDDTPAAVVDGGNEIFFAKQVINNACATQAIISVLMNRPEIQLGDELTQFKSFAQELPADMRGLAIGNSSLIRTTHNSFARPEPFVFESKDKDAEDEDAFHFIGYVPVNGKLYELDGLKEGPVLLGECDMEKWYETAKPAIEARIARYSAKEIRFNLLALVQNRQEVLEKELKELKELAQTKSSTTDDAVLTAAADRESKINEEIRAEKEKFQHWKDENVRRKHNYIPFMFNLLKQLAKKKKLNDLVDKAKETGKARAEAAAKAKQAKK